MLKLWPFFFIILNPFNLKAEEWNFKNNPFFNSSKNLETKIELLPQSFELSNLMGSEWIWPFKEGGILNRWSLKNPKSPKEKYSFEFFSFENLKNVDLSQLSPPEKFDLFLGNSNWSFSKFIKKSQNNLLESEFKTELAFSETILKFKDPRSLVLEGKTNLNIPFGSSDIGALLFASILFDEKPNYKIIGSPCKITLNKENVDQCEGINPGSFHILLSNFIGLKDKGIILDLKRDKKIELRPVVGYVSNFQAIEGPISKMASKKTKRELLVTTFIKFVRPRMPRWSQDYSPNTRGFESYNYTLELDNENNIVGGRWISFNRPDFMAMVRSTKFQENFKEIESIYIRSTSIDKEGGDLKLKTLTQKEIISEKISKNGTQDLINSMFEEYFENYKLQLTQKRSEKKLARKNLSKELKLTKKTLLTKINSIPINAPLKKISLNFIQLAESNADIKKIITSQKSFLDLSRKNFGSFDLLNAGRIAYLQQKYIDDFNKTANTDYDSVDFIQKYFLMESSPFDSKEIQTANLDFLESANTFTNGIKQERDSLKTNPSGELRIRFYLPKTKDSSSPLVASFIDDVKKDLKKTKLIDYKNWNRFLSDKKSIAWSKITFPNDSEELKKFQSPRDYNSLKKLYRLSFSIKRIQALKKIQVIPVQNNPKDKIDYYQHKFQEDLSYFKYKDFFKPLSKWEALTIYNDSVFKKPTLIKETENLLDDAKKEVASFQKDGERLLTAIKKKDLKIIDELLKSDQLLNFETSDHKNPLLTAIDEGNSEVITKVLSSNLNQSINYEDNMGKNALTIGIIKNLDPEVLKLIVDKGIDFNSKDNLGLLPRDYLKRTNNLDQYLEGLGAKLSKENPN